MYVCNKRTKIIHTTRCGFTKIMKNGTENVDFRQALDNGWRFCPHCSTVMKALKKERTQLDAFCRGRKMRYWAQDGMLIVATPSGFFRIVPTFDGSGMALWHQNGKGFHQLLRFQKFHDQHIRSVTLANLFDYIADHEIFREQNPYGVRAPKKKGDKVGKKYRRRMERYQSKVERINRTNNLMFLFDQIEQTAARGA